MSLDMDSGKRVRENRKENSQKKKKKGKERDTSVTRDSHPLHPLCAGRVFSFFSSCFTFFVFTLSGMEGSRLPASQRA